MEAKDKGSQHRLAYMLHVTGIEEATKPKHNLAYFTSANPVAV